jgi:hypothetical protein
LSVSRRANDPGPKQKPGRDFGKALSVADKSRRLEFGSHKAKFIPVVSKLAYHTNTIFSRKDKAYVS